MEIGGYLELERFASRPYHRDVYELNLGRTALVWLLANLGCTRLRMPHLTCDSVTAACRDAGVEMTFYTLDAALWPEVDELADGEYLYLINYYGQLTDARIRELKARFGRVIVDHTHAFFQRPLPGVPTLYSCRKFFGVSDGAYVACDQELALPVEVDESHERFGHLLGRFERPASEFYGTMLENAARFHEEPVKQMSALTRNFLGAIDYERAAARRGQNYRYLQEQLGHGSIMTQVTPEGPFVYPMLVKHGAQIRKVLAAQHIYVPTYWSNVIRDMPEGTREHEWAANILPLPCDQRYGLSEMAQLAEAVRAALQEFGE